MVRCHCSRNEKNFFNKKEVKLVTSASSAQCHSTRGNVSRGITPSSTTRIFGEYFLKISVHKDSQRICYKLLKIHSIKVDLNCLDPGNVHLNNLNAPVLSVLSCPENFKNKGRTFCLQVQMCCVENFKDYLLATFIYRYSEQL